MNRSLISEGTTLTINRYDVRELEITVDSRGIRVVVSVSNERAKWLAEQIINLLGITLNLPVTP